MAGDPIPYEPMFGHDEDNIEIQLRIRMPDGSYEYRWMSFNDLTARMYAEARRASLDSTLRVGAALGYESALRALREREQKKDQG